MTVAWALAAADAFDPPDPPEASSYKPRGAAVQLLERRNPEIVMSGPAGTGKSVACLNRMHQAALRYPGMRGLIVRKTAVSLGSTTLVTFREKVAAAALEDGRCHFYGGSVQEAAAYIYANGSRLVVGGLDRPTKIMSGEYDLVFADEATELTVQDWEHITTRLRYGRMPWQQQLAACNPGAPSHWIRQRATAGQLTMLESRHEDNPTLFDDAGTITAEGRRYLGLLDRLTGVRFDRLRHGRWVAAEGIVYDGWDPAIHVIDRFPLPADWTRWWGVDFGHTNPMVIQRWAEDPDGAIYLHRELYRTQLLVEDAARLVLLDATRPCGPIPRREHETALDVLDDIRRGLREWTEPRPRSVICDHDAEDRATLERYLGMGTVAANKAVMPGIDAVKARLRRQDNGRARLYVFRDALMDRDPERDAEKQPCGFVEEVEGYIWAPPAAGRPPKEQPEKVNDHSMDTARYVVAQLDLGARPSVRFL